MPLLGKQMAGRLNKTWDIVVMACHIMAQTHSTTVVGQNSEIRVSRCHENDRIMSQDQQINGSDQVHIGLLFCLCDRQP